MLATLAHGLIGMAVFAAVLALSLVRFKGGEEHATSTDLGLD